MRSQHSAQRDLTLFNLPRHRDFKVLLARLAVLFAVPLVALACGAQSPPLVLYRSTDPANSTEWKDRSGTLPPLNLSIDKPDKLKFTSDGLLLRGQTALATAKPAVKLTKALRAAGQVTLEVWLTPADRVQAGPARILTLSTDTSNRNFTLGQDGDRYDVRFRTNKTDNNGLPSLASPKGSLHLKPTHVVFTREKDGRTRMFLDGKQVAQSQAKGNLSNWDSRARLSLGDEIKGSRPWKGKLHRVAIYADAFSPAEVRKRHRAGWDADAPTAPTPKQLASVHFRRKIAPLLADRCMECHDSASAKGDLALDRKASAFADSIVPGRSEESPLWLSIEDDSMPHDRPPLSDVEKQLFKKWIDDGAEWSLGWIDPADYLNDADTAENYVRRLTVDEYTRSVAAAVGIDIADFAKETLPPDVRADGFANTAYNLTVDLKHIEAYNRLAHEIVSRMNVRHFAKQFWGKQRLTDDDMRGLIRKMGMQILRGPLDDSEIDLFRGISTSVASAGGDYEDAVAATLEAMLQSPRFLYRIERQLDDGQTDYIDDYQLASRISFVLWGSPPDEKLMAAASDGELFDASSVASQVDRMLDDPRASRRSEDFISQWLNLGHLDSLRPDHERFPEWNDILAKQMQEETQAFFRHVVWNQKRPLSDLLHAQVTFCGPELARHYDLDTPGLGGKETAGLQQYDLSQVSSRGGLLTQGSVLTIGGDDASMVTRGLFVLNQLLRGVVNDPPPCVDTSPVPTRSGVSSRTVAESRIQNEACGGCHVRFEPLAFGLEKYDGLGAFHQKDEHGNVLREDGSLLIPGSSRSQPFQTSAELMRRLAKSERVKETLVWKMAQFAVGRPLTSADAAVVREIHQRAEKQGGTYQAILKQIVLSPLVTAGAN